jgi:hypothetical protein
VIASSLGMGDAERPRYHPRRPSEIHNPLFPLNTGLRSFRLRPLMCQIWTFR